MIFKLPFKGHIWIETDYFSFKFYGKGFMFIDRNKYKAPFSVRNGFRKEYKFGKWGFQWLK